jgi:FdhE protein
VCSSWPVAGVLRGEGDGAKRRLQCALCSTEWPFRRVLCWNRGEENKDKLPIDKTAPFHSIRASMLATTAGSMKCVDLTKDAAIPMVDEIAGVALDIWAEENGCSKLEANLLGM